MDNCIGSGTTAVVVINTNRNFIGVEISKECCAVVNERINNLQQVLQVI
ncbi:DNA methyltransferase [Bacillus cereus]|nr:DNA methyltransferase [Bacillus cereus]